MDAGESGAGASRTALVTGSGQGIGHGIARALGDAGFRVVVTDADIRRAVRGAAELEEEGIETLALELDVTRGDQWAFAVAEAVGRFGGLEVLVNNAGISPRGDVETTDEALWDLTLGINAKGAFLGARACWGELCKSRGLIVNIGSTRATRPMRGMLSYGTSKAALWGLTRQLAVEGLEHGISCNMVAPGWVDTPGERVIQAAQGRSEFPEGIVNLTTVEEIGGTVAFLASPAGRRINGVTLYVDSGLHVSDDTAMVYLPPTGHRTYR